MTSDERASSRTTARHPRRALTVVLGALVASLPRSAASQPRAASQPAATPASRPAQDDFIVWQAPAGCSTAAAVRERVSELIGQPEIERERVRRVEGKVTQTREGWALNLTLVDALGARERRLASTQCADLAEAAAVAISIAFEAARAREQADQSGAVPEAANGASASSASPRAAEPDAAEPAADDAAEPDAAEPDARVPSGFSPWIGAELWLDANALPAAAGGASVLAALRGPNLRLGAFAAWLPGVERSVAPGQAVSFSLLIGGVRACYALGHGLVDTALCAGVEAGSLSARGASLLAARSVSDPWLAPQLGLELGSELGSHLVLYLRADAFAPLLRQGYAVNETDDVHHVAILGARAAFGVLFGF